MSRQVGKDVLSYALLPGLIPRFIALISQSFALSAYSVACIFYSVRLLPPTHPYVNEENLGRFGLRHVMAAAADHLDFKWKNFDQIAIYLMILSGIVLLLAQFALMGVGLVTHQPAIAAVSDYFSRTDEQHYQDLVMIVMDRVFGVPGIFKSCVSVADQVCTDLYGNPSLDVGEEFPFAFHLALHEMLKFYSNGIFLVAIFVILYFVTVVVSETAASGSPFGQRYNKTWIPLRIILFFALLIPIVPSSQDSGQRGGLNGAQLLTLWVAKTGSDFASNGWDTFNDTLQGEHKNLIATAKMPSLDQVMGFVFVAKTCDMAEQLNLGTPPNNEQWTAPYVIKGGSIPFQLSGNAPVSNGSTDNALKLLEKSYDEALEYSMYSSIEIVFGVYANDSGHPYYEQANRFMNNVWPICGRMSLPIQDAGYVETQTTNPETGQTQTVQDKMPAYYIQELYYELIKELWVDGTITNVAGCLVADDLSELREASYDRDCQGTLDDRYALLKSTLIDFEKRYDERYRAILDSYKSASAQQGADGVKTFDDRLAEKGWAGAALRYNQIADMNGKVSAAVTNLPEIVHYPEVMEFVSEQKKLTEENISILDQFNPLLSGSRYVDFTGVESYDRVSVVLYKAWKVFNDGDVQFSSTYGGTDNAFIAAVDAIFGAKGLFDMRENPDVNPLAQLSTLGKGIMDASIRNIGIGTAAEKGAPLILKQLFGDQVGQALGALGGAIQLVGYTGIVIGFGVYYVMPMMPFVYFFFAFGGWIKGIFEAMVAMPLWAMSHIVRWDGEGIAGPAADAGYKLLLEVFLRPILILFGLLASISLFSASVMVLNDIFDAVVNVGGVSEEALASGDASILTNVRNAIDEFFFTLVYTVLCYMIGLSSFKLIDQIPNQLLRWIGFTTQTFGEANQNAAEELSGKAYKGMTLSTGKMTRLTSTETLLAGG